MSRKEVKVKKGGLVEKPKPSEDKKEQKNASKE